MPLDLAFDLELEHGRCVGVRIPADDGAVVALAAGSLLPGERAFAGTLTALRRRTWVGGRVALREALARAGLSSAAAAPILADDRGAPHIAGAACGSISHKDDLAAALVAPDTGGRLGVDVELDVQRKHDIARRVLTEAEIAEIAGLESPARDFEILVRFSAKEAIYKALDPFVRRYVGFQEASVTPLPDGRARVEATLRDGEGPFAMEVCWRRFEGVVLTTARVGRI